MADMTDLMKSIYENFSQRLKSPAVGAYFLSWVFWNWKIVYYFLQANEQVKNKIEHIGSIYKETSHFWLSNFIVPLLISLVFIISVPHLNLWVQRIQFKPNTKRFNETVRYELACLEDKKKLETLRAEEKHFRELAEADLQRKLKETVIDVEDKHTNDIATRNKKTSHDDKKNDSKNITKAKNIYFTPSDVSSFRKQYSPKHLSNNRICDILNYFMESEFEDLVGLFGDASTAKKSLVLAADQCGKWANENKDSKLQPLSVIHILTAFKLLNNYPNSPGEWSGFLSKLNSNFNFNNMQKVLDKITRKLK